MDAWQRDLGDSAFEFQRVVWPRIQRACGGGTLIPVESVTEAAFAKQLDVHAGVDAWQIKDSAGMRGIASRVQWDDGRRGFPYCTFTVRRARLTGVETEYDKRLRAIRSKEGWLFPYLTVQAFLTQPKRAGVLLACAVARTVDVVDMIANDLCVEQRTTNAAFWVVPWDEMRNQGYRVWIWVPPGELALAGNA